MKSFPYRKLQDNSSAGTKIKNQSFCCQLQDDQLYYRN